MATFHTILKFLIGHVLAGAVVIIGTLLATLVCYIVGLASVPQGIDTPIAVIPEFFMLMVVAGALAVCASTCSFVVSAFLTWFRTNRPFPVWLPVVVVPSLTFIGVLLAFGHREGLDFVAMVTGLVFVYFTIYWLLLVSSGALLDFARKKFFRADRNREKPG